MSTGGSGGGGGSSTGGNGGSSGDASSRPEAGAADKSAGEEAGSSVGGPASGLNDQLFKVPCPNATSTAMDCQVAANVRAWSKTVQIGGDPGTTYKVKLKFCAVFEGRAYTGCMTSPDSNRICIDGKLVTTPSYVPTYPTLALKVAQPAHTYYLNFAGTGGSGDYNDTIMKFDYSATFDMQGGTMATFESDGGNNGGIYTAYTKGKNFTCPGVPGIMQPYAGQFFYATVDSVTPMN
jgi:hypothetical protein